MKFGEKLRFILNDRGIMVRHFAARCGISENSIHRYFDGSRKPKEDTLREIARNLCMSKEQLLEDVEDYNG